MSNYFVINKPSNLIIKVISSRYAPQDSNLHKFVIANAKKALDDAEMQLMEAKEALEKLPH